jgi:ABC-2 type transport system permease protein
MRHLKFLFALWKANLQAAMEFRSAFLTQVVFMFVNNGAYFLFWVLYFDKFNEVRGWTVNDMMLLFGISATAWGIAAFFFGHFTTLAEVIIQGRLDYYLSCRGLCCCMCWHPKVLAAASETSSTAYLVF